ncbi:MAG TPA: hypothetical protein VKK31_13575 [Thermoanaerobaculia bacterium]|nr:hypothetical protein [Thermoanaerobaculia bacterium]
MGKKRLAPTAAEIRQEDRRPPILYLRSFAEDEPSGWFALARAGRKPSREEQMVAVLKTMGPVVALGDPGEELPDLGAARDYDPTREWRERVSGHLRETQLAVLRIGEEISPSLRWEIEQSVEHLPGTGVVFILADGADRFEALGQLLNPLVSWKLGRPWRMPRANELSWWIRFRLFLPAFDWARLVIFFDQEWTPSFVVPSKPLLHGERAGPLELGLGRALRPVLERAGGEWYGEKFELADYLLVFGLAGIVLLFLIYFIIDSL